MVVRILMPKRSLGSSENAKESTHNEKEITSRTSEHLCDPD